MRAILIALFSFAQTGPEVTSLQMSGLLEWERTVGVFYGAHCRSMSDEANCQTAQAALRQFRHLHARAIEGDVPARRTLAALAKELRAAPKITRTIGWAEVRGFCEQAQLKPSAQNPGAPKPDDSILNCDYLTKSLCISCCRRLATIATWANFRPHRRLTEDCDHEHTPAKKACTRVTSALDNDLAAALGTYLPAEQLDRSTIQWSLRAADATIIKRVGQTGAAKVPDQDPGGEESLSSRERRAFRDTARLASQALSELMSCQAHVTAARATLERETPKTILTDESAEQKRQRAAAVEGEIAMGLYSTALMRVGPVLATLQRDERLKQEFGFDELTSAIQLYQSKIDDEPEPLASRITEESPSAAEIRELRDSFLEKCGRYDALIKEVQTLLEMSDNSNNVRRPVLEPVKARIDHVRFLIIGGGLSRSIRALEAEQNRLSLEPLGIQPNPMTCAWAKEAIRRQIASAWIADALAQDRAAQAVLDAVLPEVRAAVARCAIGSRVSELIEKDRELVTEPVRSEARELLKKAGF